MICYSISISISIFIHLIINSRIISFLFSQLIRHCLSAAEGGADHAVGILRKAHRCVDRFTLSRQRGLLSPCVSRMLRYVSLAEHSGDAVFLCAYTFAIRLLYRQGDRRAFRLFRREVFPNGIWKTFRLYADRICRHRRMKRG